MPRLPITLGLGSRSIEVVGLLDTGSTVNVLPYEAGIKLGAKWNEQTVSIPLVGSLGRFEARALMVFASHPQLTLDASIRLVFAWTSAENVPVIFGQTNFFGEFDVCFYRSQSVFDVSLRET
ncbi:MAG: hypothetical protein H7175_07030 [Burkholderiales bacterium]|nr:hypothetical protein [Anaerolineae bacterium]